MIAGENDTDVMPCIRNRVRGIKYIVDENKREKVLENSQVIKTLFVRNGKQSTLGD